MQRTSKQLSGFFAAILIISTVLGVSVPVQAQQALPVAAQCRIASCHANLANNSITLTTSNGVALPPPIIRYLPGPDEHTELVADFPGLIWIGDQQTFQIPVPTQAGGASIEEVRIGQFQDDPPLCRLAMASKNPVLFKLVSFKTSPGQLIVKWSNDLDAAQAVEAQEKAEEKEHRPRQLVPLYGRRSPTPQITRIVRAPVAPVPNAVYNSNGQLLGPNQKPQQVALLRPLPAPTYSSQTPATPGQQATPARTAPTDKVPPATEANNDLEEPHKGRGLIGRFHHWLGADDHDPDHKLTSPEPGRHQLSQASSNMKKHPDNDEQTDVSNNIKVKFLPPQGTDANSNDTGSPAPDGSTEASSTNLAASGTSTTGGAAAKVDKAIVPPIKLDITSDESSVVENLRIELSAKRKLNYRCFRMHDPERYIVDFDQLPELEALDLPESDSPLFYRFRAGKLPDHPNVSRLVLDLPDERVMTNDFYDASRNTLVVTLLQPIEDKNETAFKIPPQGELKIPGRRTIVVDAGHGGSDPGAQRGDIAEKELTLAIAQKLKQVLEASGATVVMTRSDDTFVSLEDRVKTTNQLSPDLFVSVHINALEQVSDVHGIETYYQTDQSRLLADSIHQCLVSSLSAPDRSVRKARFYVINHTPVPAVLAEVGFISSKDERQKLASSQYQQQVAEALAQGVMLYLAKAGDTPEKIAAQTKPVPGAGTTSALGTTRTDSMSSDPTNNIRSVSSTRRVTK